MYLKCNRRRKDGKDHNYWSIMENRHCAGGKNIQRPVLPLGEINGSHGHELDLMVECRIGRIRFGSHSGHLISTCNGKYRSFLGPYCATGIKGKAVTMPTDFRRRLHADRMVFLDEVCYRRSG